MKSNRAPLLASLITTCFFGAIACADDPMAAAEFVVTDRVLKPAAETPPLGVNAWGGGGAIEWAANNLIFNPGNEPVVWRNLHRVKNLGEQGGNTWFEIDHGGGISGYDLYASGFLSGAELRVYRLLDKAGNPIPPKDDYLDVSQADRAAFVGNARILPEGADGFPDGGFVVTKYVQVFPNANVRHGNLRATDVNGLKPGRTYWYVLAALGPDGTESDVSNEISVTLSESGEGGPKIAAHNEADTVPSFKPGENADFTPRAYGGEKPLKWEAEALPEGLSIDGETGRVSGAPASAVENASIKLRVTDAAGKTDERDYVLNPPKIEGDAAKEKPQPPVNLRVESSGGGFVTLAWDASPSSNAVAYRLKRSTKPAAEQVDRIYVESGGVPLQKWDYLVLRKKFDGVTMDHVSPRVRGIGNAINSVGWYWSADVSKTSFALAPHPQPVPAEMTEPGETCLEITANEGWQKINQTTFYGAEKSEGEALWYGQLEPGKHYRAEFWLRQEGLTDDGKVKFSFGGMYPDLKQEFAVTGEWKKHTYEFDAPDRPMQGGHAGPTLEFTGPGKLWMDNARIARVDAPEDADKPYVPNKTVLDMLNASQPESGRRGPHRIWFLSRDMEMSSILSWSATSKFRPDWHTNVEGNARMTLPMGLIFDLGTGADAASRMRPWLVLQALPHTEQDWLNLVEYLAAPYDPAAGDTPEKKPWAFKRYQQRGNTAAPWTDEFANITIEFGNETWHNGAVSEDWLGFGKSGAVTQGGTEYGLFTKYLIENMKKSPYWPEGKILFNLGAFYNGEVEKDGRVVGYGEEAVQANPYVATLGHANYVGPKWETGEASSKTFDDHGIQATFFSYIGGIGKSVRKWGDARAALAEKGIKYDLAGYEGGPSGYALPGQAPPDQVETNEKYGKSLAMGVAALDGWFGCYVAGYTDQCLFSYGQGNFWNTHTIMADGFRPHTGWLAMTLRNRYAGGDLIAVEAVKVPTLQFGEKEPEELPLTGAYAMRDGDKWSVFVVSRKLDGTHDGHDFGDGRTPVTLRLPFKAAGKITLHQLSGDPRKSNRDAANFAIQSAEVPADTLRDAALSIDLPPGAIYLYVFEGAK